MLDPQFATWAEFFAMGGHALYVWLAYGVTIPVLVGNFILLRGARKRQLRELRWSASIDDQQIDDQQMDVQAHKGDSAPERTTLE